MTDKTDHSYRGFGLELVNSSETITEICPQNLSFFKSRVMWKTFCEMSISSFSLLVGVAVYKVVTKRLTL